MLIYRLPHNKNIITPRSSCTLCNKTIQWFDNIPIASYLLLRGKCRSCKKSISFRYFIVECLSPLLMLSIWIAIDLSSDIVLFYFFFSALLIIFFIDIEHKIIPNIITYPLMIIGVVLNFTNMNFFDALLFNLFGLTVGAGIILIVMYLYKIIRKLDGMGMGDVKLFAVLGIWFGWEACLIIIFLSSLFGSFLGIIGIATNKVSHKQQLPFAPFIVLASLVYYFNQDLLLSLLKIN